MTNTGDNALPEDDQALEELLGRASPRPLPPADLVQQAKAVAQGEWQQMNRRRTTRRRLTMFATAATVVLAVTVVMNTWLAPVVPPVQVATLEKAIGTVYLLGEQSELYVPDDLSAVQSGQTIVTAKNASVGLSWGQGGSLRLDADTKVVFESIDTVELKSGRVYFDSRTDNDKQATLTISTEYGDVTHIGTQFITAVEDEELTVRVREGRVSIDGRFYDGTAKQGKAMKFAGSNEPREFDESGFGPEWEWIELTAPVTAMDGKKLRAFIEWVSRETGLKYEFESDEVKSYVDDSDTLGDLSNTPRVALRQSLRINNLDLEIDQENGVIIISQAGH